MINIGFIGAGNMGTAIMKGIFKSELAKNLSVFATDLDTVKINSLK